MTSSDSYTDTSPRSPRTNEARRRARDDRRRARIINSTTLMELGGWVYHHAHSIRGAPSDLLQRAFCHVEQRAIVLAGKPQNARVRATSLWLGRWASIINGELDRARGAPR